MGGRPGVLRGLFVLSLLLVDAWGVHSGKEKSFDVEARGLGSRRKGVKSLRKLKEVKEVGAGRRLLTKQCAPGKVQTKEAEPAQETETAVWDVQWVGDDDQYAYLITQGPRDIPAGRVWRSFDAGNTFTDLTHSFHDALPEGDLERKYEQGIVAVHVKPEDPQNIVFQGAGRYHWVSNDFGKTLRAVSTPGNTSALYHSFRVHPTVSDWALSLVQRKECDDDLTAFSHLCAKDLFLTKDAWGEMQWVNLTEQSNGRIAAFVDFDWGVLPSEQTVVFATVYEDPKHLKGPYPGWDKDIHFVRTDDFFKSPHIKVKECGNQFEILAGVVFLGVPNSCPVDLNGEKRKLPSSADALSGVSLYISEDMGSTFHEACVPTKLNQNGYSLVMTHDDRGAFVVIDHTVEHRIWSHRGIVKNVYASGDHAALYSLSLKDNYENLDGQGLDFERIEGIPGFYIANQKVENRDGSNKETYSQKHLRTQLSEDGGATWKNIPAPKTFQHKSECDRCNGEENCFLHLHGASSWTSEDNSYPGVYTHESAPGVIMASGNVAPGNEGMNVKDGTCTWLSTDGGANWKDVAIGSYIYEFGDHGGILLMAKYSSEGPTNEIWFSVDEGGCWDRIPLRTALTVDNIRIEPDGQRSRFILHGTACLKSEHSQCSVEDISDSEDRKGLVYTIDIQDILGMRACDHNDYRLWETGKCILGVQQQIQKRTSKSRCLNGGEYVRPNPRVDHCTCSETDVECDYGWIKSSSSSGKKCSQIPMEDLTSCMVVEDGEYIISETGHRFIHGVNCTGGRDVLLGLFHNTNGRGTEIHHGRFQSKAGITGFGVFAIWMLVLGVVFAISVFTYVRYVPPSVKGKMEEIATPVSEAFNTAFGWAKQRIAQGSPRSGGYGIYQPLSDVNTHRQ